MKKNRMNINKLFPERFTEMDSHTSNGHLESLNDSRFTPRASFSAGLSFFTAVILSFSLLFSSCSFGDDEQKSSKPIPTGYLVFDAVTLPGSFKSSSRDIVPSMDTDTLSNLVLKGKSKNADNTWESEKTLCQASSLAELNTKASNEEIILRTGYWIFTLTADFIGDTTDSESAAATTVNYRATSVEMLISEGANSISFNLSPVISDGTSYYGGLDFSMKYNEGVNEGRVTKVKATLQPLSSTSGLWGNAQGNQTATTIEEELSPQALSSDPEGYRWEIFIKYAPFEVSERLLCGTYWLIIEFEGDDAVPLGKYRELIIVSPCLTSTASRTFDLNEIYNIRYYVGTKELTEDTEYDGITSSTGTFPYSYSISSSITLPALNRPGFTFSHWTLGSGGSAISKIDRATLKSLGIQSLHDIDLYAVWSTAPLAVITDAASSTATGYTDLDSIIARIIGAAAEENLTVKLYSGITFSDIGRSDESGISNAVRNTAAASISIDMTEVSENGSYSGSEWEIMNFQDCTKLKSLVTSATRSNAVQHSLCDGCTALESVTIYPCANILYTNSFRNCSNLATVTFVDFDNSNLGSLYDNAFMNCFSLEELSFPASVNLAWTAAFSGCTSLRNVHFDSSSFSGELGENLFENSGIESFDIPNGTEIISENVFKGCASLKTVTIPSTATEIKKDAFSGCTSLETIVFEDTEYIWEMKQAESPNGHLTYFRPNKPSKNKNIFRLYTSENTSFSAGSAEKTGDTSVPLTMKSGPLFNSTLEALGAKISGTKSFQPCATFPEDGGTATEDDVLYLDELEEEIKAWKSGTSGNYTIYFYAKGYTDENKEIPLSSDSSTMFKDTQFQTIDCSLFDTKDVINMTKMFEKCQNLNNLDLSNFKGTKGTNLSYMFKQCKVLTSITFPATPKSFKVSDVVENGGLFSTFSECYKLTSVDLRCFDTSDVSYFLDMFWNCSSIETIDISTFEIKKPGTKLNSMFQQCSKLENIFLPSELGSEENPLADVDEIFGYCNALKNLDFMKETTWYIKGKIPSMFYSCTSLETAIFPETFHVSLGTSWSIDCHNMFNGCIALKYVDLRHIDFIKNGSSRLKCQAMFSDCKHLETVVVSPKTNFEEATFNLGFSEYTGDGEKSITGQLGTAFTEDVTSLYRIDSSSASGTDTGAGYFTSPYSVFVASSSFTDAPGSDETGDGSRIKPFLTVAKAVQSIGARINDGGEPSDGGAELSGGNANFTPGWSIIVLDEAAGNTNFGKAEGEVYPGRVYPGKACPDLVIQGIAFGENAGKSVIRGDGSGSVIKTNSFTDVSLHFRNITITGGNRSDDAALGGGLSLSQGGKVYLEKGCKITGNSLTGVNSKGAGVYIDGGELYLIGDASIGSNVNDDGTNVTQAAGDTAGSCSNYVNGNGGGIYADSGKVYIGYKAASESSMTADDNFTGGIFYNHAKDKGGGIYLYKDAELYINKGSIGYNSAKNYGGGGIYVDNGKAVIDGGEISSNKTDSNGGAIYVESECKLFLKGSVTIPGGTDNQNDVYMAKTPSNYIGDGATICLGEFTAPVPSTIAVISLPLDYYKNLVKVLSDQGNSTTIPNVSAYYSKFALKQLGSGDFTITQLGLLSQAISGNVTVTLQNEISDISVTEENIEAEKKYRFTAPAGLSSYTWYLNDAKQTGITGNTAEFDYSSWTKGIYDVRLEATGSGGKIYSYFGQMNVNRD